MTGPERALREALEGARREMEIVMEDATTAIRMSNQQRDVLRVENEYLRNALRRVARSSAPEDVCRLAESAAATVCGNLGLGAPAGPRRGGAMKYRKKPVVIEAMEFTGENLDELQAWGAPIERSWSEDADYRCPNCLGPWGVHAEIATLEDRPDGKHFVCPADQVIRGVKGEFYACKPDIFAATYEPVEDVSAPGARPE